MTYEVRSAVPYRRLRFHWYATAYLRALWWRVCGYHRVRIVSSLGEVRWLGKR
jgi:hypothetical protein